MNWLHASRSACCLAAKYAEKESMKRVGRAVVTTSVRSGHYAPKYITLEERPRDDQDRAFREEMEDNAGPVMFTTPNPYRHLEAKPAPLSTHPGVVKTLDRIVTVDVDKVFAQKVISSPRAPRFMLASDDQLEELETYVLDRAENFLKRPPIMLAREDIPKEEVLIRKNPEMAGYTRAKLVVVNVDNNMKENERQIYVRQENGDLEHANYAVRDRIVWTYFPKMHSPLIPEPVFNPVSIQHVLSLGRHKEMLDRIYHQFKPGKREYITYTEQVYEDVFCRGCYEVVDSTSHFGNLVFYLCREGRWQGIYDYFTKKNRVSQAADVYRLGVVLERDDEEAHLLANYLRFFEDLPQQEKVLMDEQLTKEVDARNERAAQASEQAAEEDEEMEKKDEQP